MDCDYKLTPLQKYLKPVVKNFISSDKKQFLVILHYSHMGLYPHGLCYSFNNIGSNYKIEYYTNGNRKGDNLKKEWDNFYFEPKNILSTFSIGFESNSYELKSKDKYTISIIDTIDSQYHYMKEIDRITHNITENKIVFIVVQSPKAGYDFDLSNINPLLHEKYEIFDLKKLSPTWKYH